MGKVLSERYAGLWEQFLAFEERKVSEQGYKGIRWSSYQLVKWLEEQDIRVEELSVQDAFRYRAAVAGRVTKEGKAVTAGTCCNLLKAARVFFRYLGTIGVREGNPFKAVGYPRLPETLRRNVLSEAQMNALLEKLRGFTTAAGYKLHILAELLYAAGLRIAEAAQLVSADIDTRQRMVYVRQGKGGKSRTAFLTSYAAEILGHYLSRGRGMVCAPHTLFGVGYSRLTSETNRALREACTALELPVITSHGFRHSLGTHLLRAGCDMRHIQVILGHEDLRSTQVYTHVNKDEIKTSLDAHHPRVWRKAGQT